MDHLRAGSHRQDEEPMDGSYRPTGRPPVSRGDCSSGSCAGSPFGVSGL